MRHYGDITKLSGETAPTVDVVIGGSPCQDLSVAGKRAGFSGERSGLFAEQIRLIKEMREHDMRTGNRVRVSETVRRLTPLECERLQGFPDGWTDIGAWTDTKGKTHKESGDAARYKALGNSIAIPPWTWVLKRLSAQFSETPTMASLFDGIGGFPLIWERLNGKGTCLWAIEIEEFCIAVTKYRFGED